jgi:Arylsulfotransferase (ASST)/Secretion system C-terminal sorting domain
MKRYISLLLLLLNSLAATHIKAQVTLPAEVPPYTYAAHGPVSPGLLFVNAFPLAPNDYATSLMLVDELGRLVYFQEMNAETAPPYSLTRLSDFRLQQDGKLCFNANLPVAGRTYLRLDSTFNLVDTIYCGSTPLDGHDLVQTPDGHFHFFCEFDSTMDLSGLTTVFGVPGSSFGNVRVELIVETDANGNVLYLWNPLYYFSFADMNMSYFTNPSYLDLTHFNSIDVDSTGNYLISSRHMDQVFYIDKATGAIRWKLGGAANMFTLTNDSIFFTGQHTAHFQPGNRISLFDNATKTPNGIARGIEYELDTTNFTATVVWVENNSAGLPSEFVGSQQVLPDGHRIINWGNLEPLPLHVTAEEFAEDHTLRMEFDLALDFISYRVMKYELPWELPRPEITCNAGSGTLVATPGYTRYWWSSGDSGQSILPADTGFYQVWADQGMGRISSDWVHVSDVSDPCSEISIDEVIIPDLVLFPNPAGEYVKLSSDIRLHSGEISILDITGRKLVELPFPEGERVEVISLPSLAAGVYLVQVEANEGSWVERLVVR